MPFKEPVISKRTETQEALLFSAKRVVARDGVMKLTLDAVAQEAGVSKGGVLYHFPTKNALVAAMMEDDITQWHKAMNRYRDAEIADGKLPEAGRNVRAFIAASAGVSQYKKDEMHELFAGEDMSHWFATAPDLRAGMIAAVAGDHTLLKRFRDEFETLQATFENDGLDPATATLARLAADGLFFVDMMGFSASYGKPARANASTIKRFSDAEKLNVTV